MIYKVHKDCNDLYMFFNAIMIFIKHDLKKIIHRIKTKNKKINSEISEIFCLILLANRNLNTVFPLISATGAY